MFENPRRGRQAKNFTTNVPKILVLNSSSEQIFSRKLPLGAPVQYLILFLQSLWHFISLVLLGNDCLYKQSNKWVFFFCLSCQFLLKANKFGVVTRDSKLTMSLDTDSKASVSINLKDANPSQLRVFLDSLNGIMAYHSSLKGKIH